MGGDGPQARPGEQVPDLLGDPAVARWNRNVARGSQQTADVWLRRLGLVCERTSTTPADIVTPGRNGNGKLRDFLIHGKVPLVRSCASP